MPKLNPVVSSLSSLRDDSTAGEMVRDAWPLPWASSVARSIRGGVALVLIYPWGQTSVGLSFKQRVECMKSIAGGTLNLLEMIRYLGEPDQLFNVISSEC